MAYELIKSEKIDLIEETINSFFERSIKNAEKIDPSYRYLWETLHGLIRSGGKRLRPQMTVMAYEAFGGRSVETIIPVAAAQELLHFSLLIHDDIIDRDYIRYGTENIAGRYKKTYSQYILSPEDQTHFAHSAAILGGDLMLSGAHQIIASCSLSEPQKSIAHNFLTRGIFEVAGGELLDTELSFAPYTNGDAIKVARYKTASYSFVVPLLTGATLVGITPKQSKALDTYAQSLGIAFQLVDDVLGVFGDQQKTGKSTSSDITEGKRTFMTEHATGVMSDDEKKVFETSFGNPHASPVEINRIKEMLESTGARQKTQDTANDYAKKAKVAIDEMDLNDIHREIFERFITMITERSH